jgi:hypothetical protein
LLYILNKQFTFLKLQGFEVRKNCKKSWSKSYHYIYIYIYIYISVSSRALQNWSTGHFHFHSHMIDILINGRYILSLTHWFFRYCTPNNFTCISIKMAPAKSIKSIKSHFIGGKVESFFDPHQAPAMLPTCWSLKVYWDTNHLTCSSKLQKTLKQRWWKSVAPPLPNGQGALYDHMGVEIQCNICVVLNAIFLIRGWLIYLCGHYNSSVTFKVVKKVVDHPK